MHPPSLSASDKPQQPGTGVETSRARVRWLFVLIGVATSLSFLHRQVLSVLAPVINHELGLSNTSYSRVVFAFVLSYTVMTAFGGRLVDYLGTRLGFGIAVAVWSVASAAHAWVCGVWSLAAARFALGVGEGPCFPAATKCVVEWIPLRDRAFALGISSGGAAFGAVAAPPLTSWLAAKFGWRDTFVAVSLLGVVWIAAWWAWTRGRKAQAQRPTKRSQVGFRDLMKRPFVRRLLLSRFITDPALYFYMFWIPQYLYQERHLSIDRIGALTWIPYLGLGVSGMIIGTISDRLVSRGMAPRKARFSLMLLGALITPASCFVAKANSAEMAIGLTTLFMIAHGFWMTNLMTMIGEAVPAEEVATAAGVTIALGGISSMLVNLAIGVVADHIGFAPIFVIMGLLYLVAWLFMAIGSQTKANGLEAAAS